MWINGESEGERERLLTDEGLSSLKTEPDQSSDDWRWVKGMMGVGVRGGERVGRRGAMTREGESRWLQSSRFIETEAEVRSNPGPNQKYRTCASDTLGLSL